MLDVFCYVRCVFMLDVVIFSFPSCDFVVVVVVFGGLSHRYVSGAGHEGLLGRGRAGIL